MELNLALYKKRQRPNAIGLTLSMTAMVLGLAVLLILLGVYPQPVLDTSAASMHGVQQWFSGALTQLASVR